jgi:hypothetical protein
MNQPGENDPDQLVAARSALLDALTALRSHLDAIVLIGAQALYLHTGAVDVALAETTKDSDLALDPRALADSPRLEILMRGAGFELDRNSPQPGSWVSANGIPVDLMVPEALAGAGGRRGARIPPHSQRAARRAAGLEAAVVDHAPMRVGALTPGDQRRYTVNVAGPAALLVAQALQDRRACRHTRSTHRQGRSRPLQAVGSHPNRHACHGAAPAAGRSARWRRHAPRHHAAREAIRCRSGGSRIEHGGASRA